MNSGTHENGGKIFEGKLTSQNGVRFPVLSLISKQRKVKKEFQNKQLLEWQTHLEWQKWSRKQDAIE